MRATKETLLEKCRLFVQANERLRYHRNRDPNSSLTKSWEQLQRSLHKDLLIAINLLYQEGLK